MSEERIAAAEKEVSMYEAVLIGWLIPFGQVLQFRNYLVKRLLSCNLFNQNRNCKIIANAIARIGWGLDAQSLQLCDIIV